MIQVQRTDRLKPWTSQGSCTSCSAGWAWKQHGRDSPSLWRACTICRDDLFHARSWSVQFVCVHELLLTYLFLDRHDECITAVRPSEYEVFCVENTVLNFLAGSSAKISGSAAPQPHHRIIPAHDSRERKKSSPCGTCQISLYKFKWFMFEITPCSSFPIFDIVVTSKLESNQQRNKEIIEHNW